MIKFMCDSCGKDISEKVLSSVRQFYGKSYFGEKVSEQVTEDHSKPSPEVHYGGRHEPKTVNLEVRLFYEFLKIIHAFAWDMSPAIMHCGDCAMKLVDKKKRKVITFFTRIADRPYNN